MVNSKHIFKTSLLLLNDQNEILSTIQALHCLPCSPTPPTTQIPQPSNSKVSFMIPPSYFKKPKANSQRKIVFAKNILCFQSFNFYQHGNTVPIDYKCSQHTEIWCENCIIAWVSYDFLCKDIQMKLPLDYSEIIEILEGTIYLF